MLVKKIPTLYDAMAIEFTGKGLFASFTNPIWRDEFDSNQLDITFITSYGETPISPYVKYLTRETNGIITEQSVKELANNVYQFYRYKWERLWASNVAKYNPIDNYNMVETSQDTVNNEMSGTDSSKTDTSYNDSSNSSINAFNSGNGVPTDSNNGGGSTNAQYNGSNSSNNHIITQHTLTREGNIGVTTSAQMIGQEIELWKWNYINMVMTDIRNYVGLQIYQ